MEYSLIEEYNYNKNMTLYKLIGVEGRLLREQRDGRYTEASTMLVMQALAQDVANLACLLTSDEEDWPTPLDARPRNGNQF